MIGQVLASDIYTHYPATNNTQDPGYLISFLSDQEFGQRCVHDRFERL